MPAPMSKFILENYDLINCQISIFQWKHEYDVDGNPVNIDFGIGETSRRFESGDRVAEILGAKVSYDGSGRQTGRHNVTFVYNDFSQLVEVRRHDATLTTFHYDADGRLALKISVDGSDTETYFYAIEDRPSLVTHVHSTRRGFLKLQVG